MRTLSWYKPAKLRPTEEHNASYVSDSGVMGTYVPNMSSVDREKWKAKKIGGSDPRVEIRKTLVGKAPGEEGISSAQILVIVRRGNVTMSANGRMVFSGSVWAELQSAIAEAVMELELGMITM